jgi:hypothetical protein
MKPSETVSFGESQTLVHAPGGVVVALCDDLYLLDGLFGQATDSGADESRSEACPPVRLGDRD